ncbi:MAG TPA: SDR family NAD(P)-dependent oxidoreductase [Caulobacteraceae bacterium]|nr:SDR family NAD(P)-dependent oxidoreductase [Caulobacteraceae bacterium]
MSSNIPSLAGRIALVTGATRGIGRACALALAGAGAHVIAVGRTQGALEELDDEIRSIDGPRPTLAPLDLTEGDGIDALGYEIFRRHQRLDILVHAAAMLGGLYPVAHIDPKLWDNLIATNVTSAYRLIRSMEPLLRQSEAGRALFLTTGQGVRKRAFWGGYAATKSALDTLVRCWADEVEHTKIRAVIIDPGVMRTRLRAQAFPGEDPATLVDPTEIGPMVVAYAGAADLGLPIEAVRFSEWKAARAAASAS